MKGLRALGVRVPGPGLALARDWIDGQTEVFPRALQDIVSFGAAGQKLP